MFNYDLKVDFKDIFRKPNNNNMRFSILIGLKTPTAQNVTLKSPFYLHIKASRF